MVLHFRKATGIYLRTFPFVLLRLGVGVLFGVLAIVYFGVVALLGFGLLSAGVISGAIGVVGLILAVIIFFAGWNLLSKYVLYLVKVGHIAVIAETVDTGEVPSGQVRYGIEQVREHFAEASILFAIDKLVKAVIRQFNNAVMSFSEFFSIVPSLKQLIQIAGKAVALAASYIDEAIIAHMFVTEETGQWAAARDGVVLYAKNWKPVLGSTLLIVVGQYAVAFLVFLALSPFAFVIGRFSPTIEAIGWVIVAGIGATIYTGLLRPWVKTVVITTFLVESQGETPDSETMDLLSERSSKFRELESKASEETAEGVDQPAASTP